MTEAGVLAGMAAADNLAIGAAETVEGDMAMVLAALDVDMEPIRVHRDVVLLPVTLL
jgi:hypothetical protein